MRSRTRILIVGAILLATAASLRGLVAARSSAPVVINNTAVPPVPALDAVRVDRGAALYSQYCAACHGINLEGAADWKRQLPDGSLPPPPHDDSGHTWHHPDGLLLEIIALGGDPAYSSKMPAFSGKLSQEEIASVLEFIKSRWGTESRQFQWWISATSRDE